MTNSSFPFFIFKNKETEEAIKKVISQYEGITEDAEGYLLKCQARKEAKLIVEAKIMLQIFEAKHPELFRSFVKFKGIIDFVMQDLLIERIAMGNKYLNQLKEDMKKNGKYS